MTIRKNKQGTGFIMECDYCKEQFIDETATNFSDMHSSADSEGYISGTIDDEWYNFCCQECYEHAKDFGFDNDDDVEQSDAAKEVDNAIRPFVAPEVSSEIDMLFGDTAQVIDESIKKDLIPDAMEEDFQQMHDKVSTFKEELAFIKDDTMKSLAENLISELPDYYFKIAASSTGKYHPSYTNGEGGLVRHTKAAVRIAIELMRLEMYQALQPYHDHIIIALILHDGWKHGLLKEDGTYAQYTKAEHPKICAEWVVSQTNLADVETLKTIADLLLTHMGQWNMGYNNGLVFAPKPATIGQCFVHLCDYLASRKCLKFNFEVPFGV